MQQQKMTHDFDIGDEVEVISGEYKVIPLGSRGIVEKAPCKEGEMFYLEGYDRLRFLRNELKPIKKNSSTLTDDNFDKKMRERKDNEMRRILGCD